MMEIYTYFGDALVAIGKTNFVKSAVSSLPTTISTGETQLTVIKDEALFVYHHE